MNAALKLLLWPYGPTAMVVGTAAGLVIHDIVQPVGPSKAPAIAQPVPQVPSPTVPSRPAPPSVAENQGSKAKPRESEVHTTFKTVTVPGHKFEIITGLRRKRWGAPPITQYCYATTAQQNSSVARQLALGRKLGKAFTRYRPVSDADATMFGVSGAEMMKLARTHCRFTPDELPKLSPEQLRKKRNA